MAVSAPTYDLVMLLDPQAEEAARAKIVSDTRTAIETKGELVRHDDWGERALTYPIDRKTSAEYHLLQFHVADNELLGGLDHTLRITDGLLRFRIIKLAPGVPEPPDMRAGAVRRSEDGEPAAEAAAPAAVAVAEAPAPAAEAEAPAPAAEVQAPAAEAEAPAPADVEAPAPPEEAAAAPDAEVEAPEPAPADEPTA